ncbi:MAG: hypothetical protein IPG08_09900 [Sphingobacteriaceae bacterium]|nr:hypothetical protein [Sphingobacteriaceae bacterium]
MFPKIALKSRDYKSTYLTITNNSSGETVGNYVPNQTGRFIIILLREKYTLLTEAPDFKEYKQPLEVLDKTLLSTRNKYLHRT